MTRKASCLHPYPAGPAVGMASVDGVLEYAGVAHPGVATHLLATLGVLLLSIGSVSVGPLLPLPLYSCWGGAAFSHIPRSHACQGLSLLPSRRVDPTEHLWQCSAGASWWSPFSLMAGLLVVIMVLFTAITGLCLDIHGRRKVAIVTMGLYFMFSISRSFSPNVEVSIVAVVLEGAAAQAATVALVLIAFENSIQKECVRAVCLVLLGHSLAVGAIAPSIGTLLTGHMWQQLAKSVPSVAFVILLCWMPESVRWVLGKGDWVDAGFLLPRTHNISLDETMKPKLMVVHQEIHRCLSSVGCRGSSLRRSVCPLVRSRRLLRVWLLGSACALLYGLTVGTRLMVDPSPYNSLPDRSLAYGATELLVLVTLALALGRVSARTITATTMAALATTTAIAPTTQEVGASLCMPDVVLSLMSHGSAVAAGVSLLMSLWRLTPTHSRGAMFGLTWAWAVAGFAAAGPFCQLMDSLRPPILQYSLKAFVCAGGCLVGALLALLLPPTPSVLPDALSHLSKARGPNEYDGDSDDLNPQENTRL